MCGCACQVCVCNVSWYASLFLYHALNHTLPVNTLQLSVVPRDMSQSKDAYIFIFIKMFMKYKIICIRALEREREN